jgi:hypothetical protein
MDYKQLRRVLRERLDAPGSQGDDDQRPEEEEHPTAVQELPVHDLPVNVADMLADELAEPPVRDAEYLPGNLQQLQHASSVLVQQVPPLQVQDFYHRLKRLVSTVVRQQDRAGEHEEQAMPEPGVEQSIERADKPDEPGSAESATPEVSEAVRRIRGVIRQQVTEHRVRKAVRSVLVEQSSQQEALNQFNREGLDYRDPWGDFRMMNPWILRRLGEKPLGEIRDLYADFTANQDARADDIIRDIQRAYLPADVAALRKLGPPFWTEAHEAKYTGAASRAATGKTGSEQELLKKISDELEKSGVKMGVSAIRNIIGRFNENLGIRYFFDDRGEVLEDRKKEHQETWEGVVDNFNALFRAGVSYLVFSELYSGGISTDAFIDNNPGQNKKAMDTLKETFGLEILDDSGFGDLGKRIFSGILLSIFETVGLRPGAGGFVGLPAATEKFRKAAYEEELGKGAVPEKQSEYTKLQKERFDVIVTTTKAIGKLLNDAEREADKLLAAFAKDAAEGFLEDAESIEDTFGDNQTAQMIIKIAGGASTKHQQHAEKLKQGD